MKPLTFSLGALALASLLACGGGGGGDSTPKTATSLAYTDPTGVPGNAFQFKKASASGSRLVLDLHGPASVLSGSGLVLTLSVDPAKATWGTLGFDYFAAGNILVLGNGTPILKGKVSGGTLQVVIAEKGTATPKILSGPLLQVALELKGGLPSNTAIVPTVDLTKSKVLLADGTVAPMADLKFGTLTAQ